mgnify:CR=1 FL=1
MSQTVVQLTQDLVAIRSVSRWSNANVSDYIENWLQSNGFNEIGLHFSFKTKEERRSVRYSEGQVILENIRRERIYDRSLIEPKDQYLVEDYLYSLETEGSKKKRRAVAKERFQSILDEIRDEEQSRLQAEAIERQRQDSVRNAQVEADRLASEARAQAERDRQAREVELQQEEEADPVPVEEAKASEVGREAKATAAALDKLSPEERRRVVEINKLVMPEDLREAYDMGDPRGIGTVDFQYVIVIASYQLDSKWARTYLSTIKEEYPDAKIFASRKRNLDYVYVGGYDEYNTAMEKMQTLRDNTEYKDAWVHIIRLSRK